MTVEEGKKGIQELNGKVDAFSTQISSMQTTMIAFPSMMQTSIADAIKTALGEMGEKLKKVEKEMKKMKRAAEEEEVSNTTPASKRPKVLSSLLPSVMASKSFSSSSSPNLNDKHTFSKPSPSKPSSSSSSAISKEEDAKRKAALLKMGKASMSFSAKPIAKPIAKPSKSSPITSPKPSTSSAARLSVPSSDEEGGVEDDASTATTTAQETTTMAQEKLDVPGIDITEACKEGFVTVRATSNNPNKMLHPDYMLEYPITLSVNTPEGFREFSFVSATHAYQAIRSEDPEHFAKRGILSDFEKISAMLYNGGKKIKIIGKEFIGHYALGTKTPRQVRSLAC
jgi:hypothetical protein